MTAVSMGFVLGGDELNTENAGWGGLIGGAIVGVMGFLITLTLFLRVKEVLHPRHTNALYTRRHKPDFRTHHGSSNLCHDL